MKFLKEEFEITIYKFSKNDLVLESNYIKICRHLKRYNLRVEPKTDCIVINGNQIASFKNFIYVPKDQLKGLDENSSWEFPKPVAVETRSKFYWKKLKTNYPYKGR